MRTSLLSLAFMLARRCCWRRAPALAQATGSDRRRRHRRHRRRDAGRHGRRSPASATSQSRTRGDRRRRLLLGAAAAARASYQVKAHAGRVQDHHPRRHHRRRSSRPSRVDVKLAVGAVEENVTVSTEAPLVETSQRHARHRRRREEDRRAAAERPQLHAARARCCPAWSRRRPRLGGASGDATPGGFGAATAGFSVNGHAQPVEQLPARRRQQQRHLQHRLRAAPAARRDPGVQDPDPLLQRRVRPQLRLGRQRRDPQPAATTLHGAAWEFNRDDALQARNFFAPPDAGRSRS